MASSEKSQNLLLQIVRCPEFQAYADGKHSACDSILNFQKSCLGSGTPLLTPTPWCGHISTAPFLFISSNPSVDVDEFSPIPAWSDDAIIDFFENRFSSDKEWTSGPKHLRYLLKPTKEKSKPYSKTQRYWSEVLNWLTDIYKEMGKDKIELGTYCTMTEIVHCGSKQNKGVNEVKQTCCAKYMDLVLDASGSSIIVVVGKIANAIFEDRYHIGLPDLMSNDPSDKRISELTRNGFKRLVISIAAPGSNGRRKLNSYEKKKVADYLREIDHDWRWKEGFVNTAGEHIKLYHGEFGPGAKLVALLSPPHVKSFTVQFLMNASFGDHGPVSEILKDVKKELDYYLLQLGEQDPWKYAIYHTTTAADMYSHVHWIHFPADE